MGKVISLVPRLPPASQRLVRRRAGRVTRDELRRERTTSRRWAGRSLAGATLGFAIMVGLYALHRGFAAIPLALSLSMVALAIACLVAAIRVVWSWPAAESPARRPAGDWRGARRPSAPSVQACHNKILTFPRTEARELGM